MNAQATTLSLEICQRILAEIEPRARLSSVRPMGAEGTHPAFVIEAHTAVGTELHLAVKCYRRDVGPAPARARREFKTLQMLQSHDVPVPAPLYLDEAGSLLGTPAIVTSFVSGKQLFAAEDALAGAREMATVLAKIHSIALGATTKEFLGDANQEMLWFRKQGEMPAWMTNHPDGAVVWDAIERMLPLRQPVPSVFVHTDYWIGQLLWQQGQISAVLDWEEAGYGDPAYDLAYCRLDFCLGKMGRSAADALLHIYEAEMGRAVANLPLWEFAAAARVMHNTAWEAECREKLRAFIGELSSSQQLLLRNNEIYLRLA